MVRFAAAALALATSFVGLSAQGGQILLLEFSTPTCGYCRQMEPLIHSFEQAGYPIRKVDASLEPQIAQQYNVTRFPTFVMLVDGRELTRRVGAMESTELQQLFRQAKDVVIAGQHRNPIEPASPLPSPGSPTAYELPPHAEEHSPEPPAAAADPPAQFADILSASVRLRVDDPQGRSFGTGTVIDARQGEALIITCGHLFRDSKGKGPVTVEMFEATASGVRPAGQVAGWVLSYDLDRDVALVVVKPGRPLKVARIAPAGSAIERGDRVVSIGCSNGADPTAISTRITTLDRYQGPPNIEAAGAPVEGRSGGGLFNDNGELIGICYAADPEGNEGLYAALESIHDEVARLNLNGSDTQLAADDSASPAATTLSGSLDRSASVVRGQDSLPDLPPPSHEPITPLAANATGPNGPPAPPESPQSVSATEHATWEEIIKQPSTSEVIIIIRPENPDEESQMFRLDRASPAFVHALEQAQRPASAGIMR